MAGFWEFLVEAFQPRSAERRPVVVRERTAPALPAAAVRRLLTGSARRIRVERDRRPLWQIRGWRREGAKLVGAFRVPHKGSFTGEIVLDNPLNPQFYILNPPNGLLNGPHSACFRARGGGKYFVHFGRESRDVDSGIVAIEALLCALL